MKKINGTWFELHHFNLAEGKYFNDTTHAFTDEQWYLKVKEISNAKMKYLVLMQTGFTDLTTKEAFFDSKYFPKSKMLKANDPLEAMFKAADEEDMKVFVSTGFYGPWMLTFDNMTTEQVFFDSFNVMEEVYAKYGHHKSFYGWYFPDESQIRFHFDEEFITYVNRYSAKSREINPNLKTLIAPYGTCKLSADDEYVEQLKRLDVDFVAYQDEVGVRKTDEYHTAEFYKNLRRAHDKANRSKLWADVEVFTFEGDVYKSALLPAPIERIERQLNAISEYVDEVLIFEYQGMFNAPNSKAYTGHPGSTKLYEDYMALLKKYNY